MQRDPVLSHDAARRRVLEWVRTSLRRRDEREGRVRLTLKFAEWNEIDDEAILDLCDELSDLSLPRAS
jgi:hypothetical protein